MGPFQNASDTHGNTGFDPCGGIILHVFQKIQSAQINFPIVSNMNMKNIFHNFIIYRSCGIRPTQRQKRTTAQHRPALINGVQAQPNSWPWMVSF